MENKKVMEEALTGQSKRLEVQLNSLEQKRGADKAIDKELENEIKTINKKISRLNSDINKIRKAGSKKSESLFETYPLKKY